MIVDLVLSNAKAYIDNEIVDCSLAIKEGKITYSDKGKICIIPDIRKKKTDSAKTVLKQLQYFYKDKASNLTLDDILRILPNGGSRIVG